MKKQLNQAEKTVVKALEAMTNDVMKEIGTDKWARLKKEFIHQAVDLIHMIRTKELVNKPSLLRNNVLRDKWKTKN